MESNGAKNWMKKLFFALAAVVVLAVVLLVGPAEVATTAKGVLSNFGVGNKKALASTPTTLGAPEPQVPPLSTLQPDVGQSQQAENSGLAKAQTPTPIAPPTPTPKPTETPRPTPTATEDPAVKLEQESKEVAAFFDTIKQAIDAEKEKGKLGVSFIVGESRHYGDIVTVMGDSLEDEILPHIFSLGIEKAPQFLFQYMRMEGDNPVKQFFTDLNGVAVLHLNGPILAAPHSNDNWRQIKLSCDVGITYDQDKRKFMKHVIRGDPLSNMVTYNSGMYGGHLVGRGTPEIRAVVNSVQSNNGKIIFVWGANYGQVKLAVIDFKTQYYGDNTGKDKMTLTDETTIKLSITEVAALKDLALQAISNPKKEDKYVDELAKKLGVSEPVAGALLWRQMQQIHGLK